MTWWQNDPVAPGMDVAQATAAWWQNDPVDKSSGPQLSELDRRANERVAKEAAAGLKPGPSVAQYLPFGSWLDEASAGIDAGLNKLTGGAVGQPYDEAKAYQNARQRYVDENTGLGGKIPAIVGGIAASLPFGAVRAFQGTTMLPRIGNAAITGAGYGAVYGAGEGEGSERITNAAKGAAIGAATGAIAVPVATGIGNAVSYVRNRMTPLPQGIQNFERGAVNRVADDIETSGLTRADYARQAQELGPEGMLLDMGDDLRGSAEVLAQTRGPQLPVVRGNLNDRRNTAPDRIRQGISAELGQEMNLPRYVEGVTAAHRQAADPHYRAFYASNIEQTPELRRTLSQIPRATFTEAEKLARADGVRQRFRLTPVDDPMTAMTGVRSNRSERIHQGVEYDYLKRAVDDMARGATPGSNEQRIYSGLARNLRNQVDEILSPGAPAQSPWAIGRQIAGDGLEGREAAELGSTVFRSKRDPHIVEDELQGMSQLGQNLYRYGARNDVRQTMGRAATNFGPRGDNAGRKTFNNEFARENLAQIAGPQNAQRLTAMIDAENRMAESFNEIMMNSATARRQAGQSRLPMGAGPPVRSEAPRSFGEAAFAIARRGVNALANGALGERAGRIMRDQARLLSARGIDRDTYVQALMRLADDRRTSNQGRQAIEQMINAVTQNARTPLIEGATSPKANR